MIAICLTAALLIGFNQLRASTDTDPEKGPIKYAKLTEYSNKYSAELNDDMTTNNSSQNNSRRSSDELESKPYEDFNDNDHIEKDLMNAIISGEETFYDKLPFEFDFDFEFKFGSKIESFLAKTLGGFLYLTSPISRFFFGTNSTTKYPEETPIHLHRNPNLLFEGYLNKTFG